jgi:hypothetical protein
MRPYQFYSVKSFPNLTMANPVTSCAIQSNFFGDEEKIETTITLIKSKFQTTIDKLRIESGVWRRAGGYIKSVVNGKLEKIEFREFVQPTRFPAYHDPTKGVFIFQASKKICRGVILNLKGGGSGVILAEMRVDFSKVYEICKEYLGVNFSNVSTYVKSAGLYGKQLQRDPVFKELMRAGFLSSVVISWNWLGEEHPIMLTGRGTVVLVNDYKENEALELRLVEDVFDRLVSKVWEEQKTKTKDGDNHFEP